MSSFYCSSFLGSKVKVNYSPLDLFPTLTQVAATFAFIAKGHLIWSLGVQLEYSCSMSITAGSKSVSLKSSVYQSDQLLLAAQIQWIANCDT